MGMEFGKNPLSEREKQRRAVENVTKEAFELVATDSHTVSFDLRHLNDETIDDIPVAQLEIMKMSAMEHIRKISKFYEEHYPQVEPFPAIGGVYSLLPRHDVVTNEIMMLLTSNVLTSDNRNMRIVQVSLHEDEFVTISTLVSSDDGEFSAISTLRPVSDKLIIEMLNLVDTGQRDIVIQLMAGGLEEDEALELMSQTRQIIATRYDEIETERFMQALGRRYVERRQALMLEKQLEMPGMTSEELEKLLEVITAPDKWV